MLNYGKGEMLSTGDIYIELHRVTEDEFEMWDQEPCLDWAE